MSEIKVGDKVVMVGCEGTVLATHGDVAWVKPDGAREPATYRASSLKLVPEPVVDPNQVWFLDTDGHIKKCSAPRSHKARNPNPHFTIPAIEPWGPS